jgi:hypothetical protein
MTGGEARLRYCFYFGRGERGLTVAYRSCRTSREKSSSESTFYVSWSELSLMVCVCRLVTPMFSDSHPRVRYANCQCVYVLLLIAFFVYTDHSIFQWTAMYGLRGNTTRVSQTDVNLTN